MLQRTVPANTRRVWNVSISLTAGSGLICALLMFLLSDVLSRRVLGEPMSAIAMKILAVNLILLRYWDSTEAFPGHGYDGSQGASPLPWKKCSVLL